MQIVAVLALVASMSVPTAAWWCNGHMLTVQIAMKTVSSSTLFTAQNLADVVNQWYPNSPDLLAAACWADDLKTMGVEQFSDWHFMDQPYIVGPVQVLVNSILKDDNVVWAIQQAIITLSTANSTILDKALQLRFLIHFLGDIHQPLHMITQFSPQFPPPVGDQGGNLYPIQGSFVDFLHPYIDSGAGQWAQDYPRPLSPENATWVANTAVQIMQEFPQSTFVTELAVSDPNLWAQTNYETHVQQVYSIPVNGTVTSEYEAAMQLMTRRQVALGGYRLAALLEQLLQPAGHLRGSRK